MVYIILDDGRAERRAGGEQGGVARWLARVGAGAMLAGFVSSARPDL